MADDKRNKSTANEEKPLYRPSKKSTSKRRAFNVTKDNRSLIDITRTNKSPAAKILPIRERTVIGQEASPKKNENSPEPETSQEVKTPSFNTVEFCENVRSEADGSEDCTIPDTETEELSKLRCPSERTEVIAEREKRRRQRCADYPGLAFGSSIFSSDTLMKFSVIKNELHNILNSQLKRVSTSFQGFTVNMIHLYIIILL